jgi:hypothetical protein
MGSEAKYWATAVLVLNTCDSFAKTSLSLYIYIFPLVGFLFPGRIVEEFVYRPDYDTKDDKTN